MLPDHRTLRGWTILGLVAPASLALGFWRPGRLVRSLLSQEGNRYEVIVSRDVMIPMRDGVRLATDVYRPGSNGLPAAGKFPVIMERTPYGKAGAGWAAYFVSRGYVAVAQDVRGRYDSEGSWRPDRDDGNDGFDTAKWIGEQPWSDRAIGTVGTS